MKTLIRRNTLFVFIAFCVLTVGAAIIFSITYTAPTAAYAMETEDEFWEEMTEIEDDEFESIMMLSGDGGRSSNAQLLSGTNNFQDPFSTIAFSDLTSAKYIDNANYFLINPRHFPNDGNNNLNSEGVCTTDALQMLMGYHNYYSDRRIIPATGNNRTFLDATYGNLAGHPAFQRNQVGGNGCFQIGTRDDFFMELYDNTWLTWFPGLGQAIGLVKDSGIRFLNNHTPQAARNDISLTSGFFSASTAKADIGAGRPIVLGFQPILTGADKFHVVPAYGYAKLDGVDGFLVHYGWGSGATQVWVPSNWFGYQIRMNVSHTHNFTDTGLNRYGTHRDVTCSACGATSVDPLFNLSGGTISGVRHTLSGSVQIPNSINVYNAATASFASQNITAIGSNAFVNQAQLTRTIIPTTVTDIGSSAFQGTGLTLITIPASVQYIGNSAFAGCTGLQKVFFSYNSQIISIGSYAFNGCSALFEISIPLTISRIEYVAFAFCPSLTAVTLSDQIQYVGDSAFAYGSSSLKVTIDGKAIPLSWHNNWAKGVNTVVITNPPVAPHEHVPVYQLIDIYTHSKTCTYTNCTHAVTESHSTFYKPIYSIKGGSATHEVKCHYCTLSYTEPHLKVGGIVRCCILMEIMVAPPILEYIENTEIISGVQISLLPWLLC